ncbi:MAG: sulfatase [Acidobacteriota bacterium]
MRPPRPLSSCTSPPLVVGCLVVLLACGCGGDDEAANGRENQAAGAEAPRAAPPTAPPTGQPATPTVRTTSPAVIDLGRRLRLRGVPDDPTVSIEVWRIDEDERAVLFEHPPRQLRFGPFTGRGCSLRFGLTIRPEHWQQTDGVGFRVVLEAAVPEPTGLETTQPSGAEEHLVFEEALVPSAYDEPRWFDREVQLPPLDQTTVRLETTVGAAGDPSYDHAAWSSPHLVCDAVPIERTVDPRPSILLVSIDTLRRDHLGVYGYARDTSPAIDRLATHSVVFDRALSNAPFTLPTHATMLTGLDAATHRAGFEHPEAPLADVTSLAERLRAAGYRTVALSAGGLMSRRYGLDRGFDEWHELQRANLRSTLPTVLDALLHPADGAACGPVFILVHTYDVHGPYQQPVGHRTFRTPAGLGGAGHDGPSPRDRATDEETWQRVQAMRYHRYLLLDRFAGLTDVIDAYDSGIHFVDSQLELLERFLERADLADTTVRIVTSDHGESLFDRGRYLGHSYSFDDAELRIPLIVHVPGQLPARRDEPVGLLDLAPTILRLAELEVPATLPGIDLLAPPAERAGERQLAGGSPHLGSLFVRDASWLVATPTRDGWRGEARKLFGATSQQFDHVWRIAPVSTDGSLAHAPRAERSSVGEEVPRAVRDLVRQLHPRETPGALTVDGPADGIERDPEAEADLRALGYLQ